MVTITRGTIAQIASFAGATAFLAGILGLVWQGAFTAYVWLAFLTSVAGIALWAIMTPQDFMNFLTGRQARRSTIAVFSTLFLTGIVVLVYIIVARSVLTVDMTNSGEFTLSPETMEVIERVNRPIRITGFYNSRFVASRDLDDQFFRLYESESDGMISRQYIDPVEEPDVADRFNAQNGDVFISYVEADGSVDLSSVRWVPLRDGMQERDMTQAINELLAVGNFTVYFVQGSGELSPEDESNLGLSNASNLLRARGINVQTLDLVELAQAGEPIPRDATSLIIARPQRQYTPAMVNLLNGFLAEGGALFILADATINDAPFLAQSSQFNQYLWDNWGLRMLDAVVIDEAVGGAVPWEIFSYAISDVPMTASLDPVADQTTAAQFYTARAVEIDPEPPVNNGAVIRSSEYSYGETDIETLIQSSNFDVDTRFDIPGPLATVGYAIDVNTDAKVMLFGDADFITNGRIRDPNARGNGYLFMDSIGWMTGFTDQVSIAPQAVGVAQPLIFVSTERLDQIALMTIFVMPGLALLMGAGVWFYRVRR